MAREAKAGQEIEREKIRQALKTLKGNSRPVKGAKRICVWDQATSHIRFKDGGARQLKDFSFAKKYVEKNGYRLEEK